MLFGAATIFTVRDVAASVAHYRDVLGFDVAFEYQAPPTYACLCRDDVQIHLIAADRSERPPGGGAIAIFVEDVDGIHAELVGNGANVVKPPQDYDYGMRDFDIVDPDGNSLVFGMASVAG